MSSRFAEIHARSLSDPESFWAEAAEAIHWTKRWDRVLDDSNPPSYRWFAGGELNTSYNALDLHVESGRGDDSRRSSTTVRSPAPSAPTRTPSCATRPHGSRGCWPGLE